MVKRCGFVSVIGLPNAGKSTLVNTLVGQKVSIVSSKVHTTRARVLGIALHEESQILLMDTPGIFKAQKTLERAMVASAMAAFEETDAIIHIVDVLQKDPMKRNAEVLEALKGHKNVILVLNKVDQVEKPKLLDISIAFNGALEYAATFMISAKNAKGTADLLRYLAGSMPEGVWHYGEDEITDMPMRLMAAEITREAIFQQLHEEVPYAVHVSTEEWEEFDNGSVRIAQVVYVQRESQKAIVLGKGGARIQAIGSAARVEIENFLGRSAHLKLFVKVQEDWAERAENLAVYGLEKNT